MTHLEAAALLGVWLVIGIVAAFLIVRMFK
jgi:hypothetical protein